LYVEIPVNTTATIYLPSTGVNVTENGKPIGSDSSTKYGGIENGKVIIRTGLENFSLG
jgi:hypothetical protein